MATITCLQNGNYYMPTEWQLLHAYRMATITCLQNGNYYMPTEWQLLHAYRMATITCLQNGNYYMPTEWQLLHAYRMATITCLQNGNYYMPTEWQLLHAKLCHCRSYVRMKKKRGLGKGLKPLKTFPLKNRLLQKHACKTDGDMWEQQGTNKQTELIHKLFYCIDVQRNIVKSMCARRVDLFLILQIYMQY